MSYLRDQISTDELLKDLKRIDQLMHKGIHIEEKTGKEYFTGYEYKCLYDWDQYFESIVQLYLGWDSKYIKNGITIFLDYQQDDGFIQRSVPAVGAQATEHVKPFLAQIALLVYKREKNLEWLSDDYYRRMKKYLNYWLDIKDQNGNHLSVWDSAPHTGMDNQHERAGWWYDCISEGVDLNSYLYRECQAFTVIAGALGKGEDASYFTVRAELIKNAIQTLLWDDKDGFYYDRNEKTGESIKVKSVAGFAPLWAGIATPEQVQRMVSEHLLNPKEFWRPFPVPALAASEKGYSEEFLPNDLGCSWRANTWMPTNYYIFQGLRRYGYNEIASELAAKTYLMIKKIGDREYYTSESCGGCGLNPFWGWSLIAYFMPVEDATGYDPTRIDFSMWDMFRIHL